MSALKTHLTFQVGAPPCECLGLALTDAKKHQKQVTVLHPPLKGNRLWKRKQPPCRRGQ